MTTPFTDEKKYIGKTVIVGGATGIIRTELLRALLNDGVANLGILDFADKKEICEHLKKEFPNANILYESVDLLNRASTIERVKKMKKTFKSQIAYFIIDAHRLSDDKVEQIKDPNFFIAVNLTLVGIAVMDAKKDKHIGGVITMLIPLENILPNSKTFPSYNAKKHALTGYMIALSEEYKDIDASKLTFLAIAYKTNSWLEAEVQKAVEDMSLKPSIPKRTATTLDMAMHDIPETTEPSESSSEEPSTSAAARIILESQVSTPTGPLVDTPEIKVFPPRDAHMEDVSEIHQTPKSSSKRGHSSPTLGHTSNQEEKSDVQLITSIIGSVNREYVLWIVHSGEKKSLHFAKYCP